MLDAFGGPVHRIVMWGYRGRAIAFGPVVDAAMILDHWILESCGGWPRRVVDLRSLGGYVEMIATAGRRGHVEAVVGAILHALHALEEAAGEALGWSVGIGRVVVVPVVGLGVAPRGVQWGYAYTRSE
jgi:hypothetical protein